MGFGRLGLGVLVASALAGVPTAAAALRSARLARIGPAPAGESLQLVLPLKADLTGLQRTALAVTTPGSPQYGQYQPIEQLARRYGASPNTQRRVTAYLRRAGARQIAIDPTGLFADATMPASLAQRTFGTPLAEFRARDGARFIAPAEVSTASTGAADHVPATLRGLITGVVGLDNRPLAGTARLTRSGGQARAAAQPSSAMSRTGTPAGCSDGLGSGGFTPNQYLSAYGYGPLRSARITGQGERVALIEVDGFKYDDLKTFAQCFGLPIPALNTFGVGISKLLPPGGEATLDLEVLDAAAPGLASINVFETKASAADTLRALIAPLRTKQKPQVISASLGLCEPALTRFVGNAGTFATEGALEMASASGISFVASSGDQGSADCTSSRGDPLRLLAVNYPSSSWWVTGVGGTNLQLSPANQIVNQIAWNEAAAQPGSAGGGGTSDLFKRPNYQRGSSRAKGRAVPDVSMLADIAPGYAIFCSAEDPNCVSRGNSAPWEALGGTSAATPLLAGGLAIVDQQLRAAHKQPLGLVNPLLYASARSSIAASVFYDVTAFGNDVGFDLGNHQPLGCCTARTGYDEASGIGSISLAALAAAALSRQPAVLDVGIVLPRGQHPVRQHALEATVSCTGRCSMGAYALVTIGRSSTFEVDSRIVRLRGAGRQTFALRFTGRQLGRLRSALANRTRVSASVHGVLLDPTVYNVLSVAGRSIQKQTGPAKLTINS